MENYSKETPSPSTSPVSPSDNTVLRSPETGSLEEVLTFSDCQELAKAVKDCSKSVIEGNWVKIPDVRGTTPRFIPDSFESAKAFLKASVESLPRPGPRRRPIQSLGNTPLSSRQVSEMGVCHGCHGSIGGGAHQGSAPGKNVCTFPHSPYCKGGIVETETWAPCPNGYIYNTDLDLASGPGFDSTLHTFQFQERSSSTPAVSGPEGVNLQGAHYIDQGLQSALNPQQASSASTVNLTSVPASTSGGRRLLQREFPDTEGGMRETRTRILSDNVQARIDAHRAENQIEREIIDRPSGSLHITSLRENPELRAEVEALMELVVKKKIPSLAAHQSAGSGQISTGTIPKVVGSIPTQALPSTGSRCSSSMIPQQSTYCQPTYSQPTWSHGMRAPPYDPSTGSYQGQVNYPHYVQPPAPQSMPQNQHHVSQVFPSYMPGNIIHGNPGLHVDHMQQGQPTQDVDLCYEWVTDSMGRRVLIRTHLPPPRHSHPPVNPRDQGQLKPQQQAPQQVSVSPQQYRTEFRCSPTTGRQWTIQVPVQTSVHSQAAEPVLEWRIHPSTGERYQVPVQLQSQQQRQYDPVNHQHPQQVSTTPVGQQHHQGPTLDSSHLQHHDQSSNNSMARQEHVAGIVSLMDSGAGTRKAPNMIEFAKKCPTRWSKGATLNNINLPLYAWGVLEEIEAALSGRTQSLPSATILGKLRHLKNTLEVCCQNSTSQDFSGFGWTLAKDYANKLNDEIEQGKLSWQDVASEVKTSTLMSASMENPRPAPKLEPKKPKTTEEKRDLCTTYNKCTTENKCDYEVANPTKTCQRRHECSWCRSHKNQGWRHQEWKCRNKGVGGSD